MSGVTTTKRFETFSKSFTAPNQFFSYFQRPPYISGQDPYKISGFMSSHLSSVPLKPSSGSPVMLVSLEISILILFPKLEAPSLLRRSLVPLPSFRQIRYTQYHKWRRHIPLPS